MNANLPKATMAPFQLLRIVLAVLVLSLNPVAHASPPDETWIAGLYDDADYDDAVLAVTATTGSLDSQPRHDPQCGDLVIALVVLVDESVLATPALSSNCARAPPPA